MGRSPLPSNTVYKALNLKPEVFGYLQEVAARMNRTPSDALNQELEFYRTWGLMPSRVRRVNAAAAARKQIPRDFVHDLVREAALKLPPQKGAKREPREGKTHRTSMNVSGPNADSLLGECAENGISFNAALIAQLEFVQAMGLHPDLLGAIDKVAHDDGDTRRDVVLRVIRAAAELLPPVELPTRRPAR